jgi:hypothetical protein
LIRCGRHPGRLTVAVADLTDLRAARDSGIVELPLRLFWSLPGHRFDLDDNDMRLWLYQTALREAPGRVTWFARLDLSWNNALRAALATGFAG